LTEQTEKLKFLSEELISVQTNVDTLVCDMERAIAQADAFIASLQAE
jgi:t-SNARE complex subunit (syntaxin)